VSVIMHEWSNNTIVRKTLVHFNNLVPPYIGLSLFILA